MKKETVGIISFILIIVAAGFLTYISSPEAKIAALQKESIVGCYVARLQQDVYTLKISSQPNESVIGSLNFANFNKDSSRGSLVGTYKNNTLLGTYSFASEGVDSMTQVIFKRQDDDFIRGFGDMSTSTNNFLDLDAIDFDSSVVFKKETCKS